MKRKTLLLSFFIFTSLTAQEWRQEKNWITDLDKGAQQNLMGAEIPQERAFAILEQENLSDLPQFHSWRNHKGENYMTPIRNQGKCGSCVVFASIGTLEAQINITNDWPNFDVDLSEQHMLACSGGDCQGWMTGAGPVYLQRDGAIAESYYPYISGSIGEDLACVEIKEANPFKIKWSEYVGDDNHMDYTHGIFEVIPVTKREIIEALLQGPLLTSMTVYEDFVGYAQGVYSHTTGDVLGGHAVVIVGYSIPENYWIVRNSWGPEWGEGGYFRISMDDEDSGVGQYNHLYHLEPFEKGALSINNLPERTTFAESAEIEVENSYKKTLFTYLIISKDGKEVARKWMPKENWFTWFFGEKGPRKHHVKVDWSEFEDGVYTLQAVTSIPTDYFKKEYTGREFEKVYSEPQEVMVVKNKPNIKIEIADLLQDDETVDTDKDIVGRVYLKLEISFSKVPPEMVEVVLKNTETDEVTIIRNRKPADVVYVSWRTTGLPDGPYSIFARTVTGKFISRSESLQVIVNNSTESI